MISVLLDRNNFIRNLLTAKSNDFKSLFVSAKHFIPYRIHFDIINSSMTSFPYLVCSPVGDRIFVVMRNNSLLLLICCERKDLAQNATQYEMRPVYGDKYFTRPAIHVWCKKFARGRESVVDEEWSPCCLRSQRSIPSCGQTGVWWDVYMNLDDTLKNETLMFDV